LEQIRDEVNSLNDKIDHRNNEFEIIDEYEMPEENLVTSDEYDRTEDRINEIRDRIKSLNNEIEIAKVEDSDEEEDTKLLDNFKTDETEVEDETNSFYERLNAVQARIDFLKNEINAGLEEEENFELEEYVLPSEDLSSEEVVDETNVNKRINAIKERIDLLKNKISEGHEEEENFEPDNFKALDDSLSEEYDDESENKANDLRDRMKILGDKIIGKVEDKVQAGDIVPEMRAYKSEDKNGNIEEKKELEDYGLEEKINLLKEELHDTINNVDLEGGNDSF